jgi:hypothetical protein
MLPAGFLWLRVAPGHQLSAFALEDPPLTQAEAPPRPKYGRTQKSARYKPEPATRP